MKLANVDHALQNNTIITHKQQLKVGVLMGGRSIEHEASFNSGRTVCDHLDTYWYNIIPIYQARNGELYLLPWHFLYRGKTTDFVSRLTTQAQHIAWDDLPSLVDFVYIATHGRYAEDGTLQGFLEILGIPYLGSGVMSSAMSMDKIMQKSFLTMHNIHTPAYCAFYPHELSTLLVTPTLLYERIINAGITGPYIIKPHHEGSSLGVSLVVEQCDIPAAIKKAAMINNNIAQAVIIEQKIEGMEFTCIVLWDYRNNCYLPLPPTEVVPLANRSFFDYEQKYMPGNSIRFTPARCSPTVISNIQKSCIDVAAHLGFTTLARIDGFVTADERIVIVDPNALSAMGPASFLFLQAAEKNMSHTALINHLIMSELSHRYQGTYMLTHRCETATPKIRVAILMGGNSHEKEISLESGRNVTYKLSPEKYEAIPFFVTSTLKLYRLDQSLLVRNATHDIQEQLNPEDHMLWSHLPHHVDFVFIALHGGEGENGCVQGMLEMLNIPYNGSGVLTSALCMDKYKTNSFLRMHKFDVPHNQLLERHRWDNNQEVVIKELLSNFTMPCIVKPHDDGCSTMVYKVHNEQEMIDAITTIFKSGKQGTLIEQYIDSMELTVGVMGNHDIRVLPPTHTINRTGILSIEEKFLPGAGENQTPAPLSLEAITFIQDTIKRVYVTLQCKGYARIDCFYQAAEYTQDGKEKLIILEVNTLPGLTPATCLFHQAAELDIKPMDFIDTIITLGFELHAHMSAHHTDHADQNQELVHQSFLR